MKTNVIFESERLIFRLWNEKDSLPFALMNNDDDVMAYFPYKLSKKASDAFIDRMMNVHKEQGYGLYAVELKATGDFIGFIGFAVPSFEEEFMPCIEIGWRLNKEYWHQGYATEGALACLSYGFDQCGFEEVVSFTSKINRPSIAVMKRIGLTYVIEFQHPSIEDNHELKPHVLYKLTKASWIANK